MKLLKLLLPIAVICIFAPTLFAQNIKPASVDPPFLMEVRDIFAISGVGTAVLGTIERGVIRTGERIEIVGIRPVNITTVTMVTIGGRSVPFAAAGSEVSLILKGVQRDNISRGQLIVKPGSVKAATMFEATIDMFASHERGRNTPIATGYRPQIVFRTVPFSGLITLPPDKPTAAPGTKGLKVTIELTAGAGVELNSKFTIRDSGREVGTGVVTGILP
jgi:elongation factor Tu